MQKQLLSRKETATLLSISLPTLAKYTREGILKARVLGNIIRYDYEEILKSFNVN
ncbi:MULTISPECIES: helix-turn-helix domain-containing protein [Sphingobacterium]|uniref:helix-turn-helix domain-containing protein n=1 Tax=Sphingobacterium TaxID=28453 RepID=UPI0013DB1872|nr:MULTISPECIES: helix-turn-helix domain-containing protein [unclassified Sphingobacterium]